MNIITYYKSSKFIFYSDSKSVLLELLNKDTSTPLITKLLQKKMNPLFKNSSSILTWIQSHIGMNENERDDEAARKALMTDISNTKIPYTNLKPTITKSLLDK